MSTEPSEIRDSMSKTRAGLSLAHAAGMLEWAVFNGEGMDHLSLIRLTVKVNEALEHLDVGWLAVALSEGDLASIRPQSRETNVKPLPSA